MKYGLVVCKNDPITYEIVGQYKKIIKENSLNKLFVFLLSDGCEVDINHRKVITSYMIYPYRKICLINDINEIRNIDYKKYSIDESSSAFSINNNYDLFNFKTKRYLIENCLYGKELVKSMVNEKRYLHCLSVANVCCDIAKSHNLDSFKAYKIGLYHDIAKGFNSLQIKQFLDIYRPFEKQYPEAVAHQFIGMHILSSVFKMNDKQSLKAIRNHCLGLDNGIYSKIIFIADKIDPLRGYDVSYQYELAKKDIDKAFDFVKKQTADYLKERNI